MVYANKTIHMDWSSKGGRGALGDGRDAIKCSVSFYYSTHCQTQNETDTSNSAETWGCAKKSTKTGRVEAEIV